MLKLIVPVALVATLSVIAAPAAEAAPGFSLQAGAFVDDSDGTSYDLAAQFRPSESLTLSLGGGQSDTSVEASDFSGSSVHGGIDLHRGRFGAALHASQWKDSDQFSSRIVSGELSWTFADSLDLALLLEDRALQVDYTVTGALGRTVAQSARFSGNGLGARLAWTGEQWSAYAGGTSYDYDDRFDRLVTASRLPTTARFPRIAALVNSVLTRTAGALDYQASVGIERAYARAGIGADVTLSSDALSGADSTSYSASFRYDLSAHWGVDASLGMTDTEGFDSVGFAGLGFSFRN